MVALQPAVALLVAVAWTIPAVDSIRCYECDEIPGSSYQVCPGGNLVQLGKTYDACIVYRLSTGRIVFQDGVSTRTAGNLCERDPGALEDVIRQNFGQYGNVMCCRSDGCNKDIPDDFADRSRLLFLEDFRAVDPENLSKKSTSSSCSISLSVLLLALVLPLTTIVI